MKVITLLSRPGCHLCEGAEALLRNLQWTYAFELDVWDITTRHELLLRYRFDVPVGVADDGQELFRHRIDVAKLEADFRGMGVAQR